MPRTAIASDDGFPWKLAGAILGVLTIGHIVRGKKVSPLDALGAILAIISFLAE